MNMKSINRNSKS